MREITDIRSYYASLCHHDIIEGRSISDWKSIIHSRNNNIFFRGQSAKHSTINTSLSRKTAYVKNEHAMYAETIKEKEDDFSGLDYPIEKLSKMQHYGMPTRLIDFTIDPLTALYFAVEDDSSEYDAIVYVYMENGVDLSSSSVNLISMLPTLPKLSIPSLQDAFLSIYKTDISANEIFEILSRPVFLNFTSELKSSNPRLESQYGTFAVCGNRISDNIITSEIFEIDTKRATAILRVPQQFKASIKRELNDIFTINVSRIYPELMSWAEYIKNKYSVESYVVDDSYSIINDDDISIPEVRRKQVKIVLSKGLNVEEVRLVVRKIVNKEKAHFDIVWVYVFNNTNDYIIGNWILKGLWFSMSLDSYYYPAPTTDRDDHGYIWEHPDSLIERSNYGETSLFKNDKLLFICYHHCYHTLNKYYHEIDVALELMDYEAFAVEVKKRSHVIKAMCKKISEYGRSKNSAFDDYLFDYIDFITSLLDLTVWAEMDDKDENWLDFRIYRSLSNARNALNNVARGKEKWMSILGISKDELDGYFDDAAVKKALMYRQTIPINENPLDVDFALNYSWTSDDYFRIQGTTTLYDFAKLLITLEVKYGDVLLQGDSVVNDGCFTFSVPQDVMKYNNYAITVSLPYPRTQDRVFLDKAGIEYENLSGKHIQRSGINSTIHYHTDYFLKQH